MRILELREAPFDATILGELGDRLATDEDGASSGSSAGRGCRRDAGARARRRRRRGTRVGRSRAVVRGPRADGHRVCSSGSPTEIQERFGVDRLAIVHRTGEVPLGEASVAVVAVSPHRDAAFNAARYAIDETKARAPIWKAERLRRRPRLGRRAGADRAG